MLDKLCGKVRQLMAVENRITVNLSEDDMPLSIGLRSVVSVEAWLGRHAISSLIARTDG
ncbi:hypothetical protein [Sphingobium scionense]|uniref:hypothetical protein n=1 Tax=Sphingobium scionense TaxID=1404341 RepID=UPI003617EE49